MPYSNSRVPVILLAFANDAAAPLRELALEQDALSEALDQARRDGKCQIITLAAATPDKIIKTFQQHQGHIRIFYYGGHSDQESLFLRKDFPGQNNTKASHLAEFLGTQENLELVFINGCLSAGQAEFYHRSGVPAVIVTDRAIGDLAAREFAQLSYRGLAGGATISEAFQVAETAYRVKHGDLPRGIGLHQSEEGLPWQLFPEGPHHWRLPLVAKHLTRIPTIDLEKEFLGRAADMQRLKEKLENASKVVLMNGLGGIGKTVLATAYVQQFGGDYDHLAWINRGEDLIESVASNEFLADTLGLPFEQEEELEIRFGRILRKLHQMPGQNLLVIDNAREQVAQKEIYDLLPGLPNWRVLLTSRLQLSGFDRLLLETLEPDASRALFRMYFKRACTEEELEALLQEIGYHTLTVELLAKLLHKLNGILSVAELIAILRQKQLDDPDLQETVWARHSGQERGIYLHLMKAFELSRLEEREKWLLKQFVVLPVERYVVTTLADFLQEKPLGLNKTLNSLVAKGWLSLHDDQTFSIHRLIRQVAEYQLQPVYADVQALVESMIQKMSADAYTSLIAATIPWMNYATTVADFFIMEKQEPIATLQNNIALTYRDLGQYEQALGYHQKAQAIWEVVLEPNHPYLATSHNNIALTFHALGQYEQALGYHQKALVILESALEANRPYLATSYHNIASIYNDLGQYEQALDYHQKALAIRESVLEANHPDLAQSYNNIAATYRDLGQYERALGYHQKDLAILELVLEANHPSLATSYNNIAVTYLAHGQYERALGYHQKALAIRKSVLEANHPDLAQSYNNIAETYSDLGQYERALDYHQKARAIREAVLQTNHPSLATSYHNIAATYRDLGQYVQALGYHQKAQAILEAVLEANHPYLAQSYNNIALTYSDLGQYEQALGYQQKSQTILESVLEANHPDLANSYNNIATTYSDLGQYEQALGYHQKALVILESVLEASHPSLATSYHNIAETYRDLGQYEQALGYHQKALAIFESVLEANHPYLATSYHNIAATYRDLGQMDQATAYEAKAAAIRKKKNE